MKIPVAFITFVVGLAVGAAVHFVVTIDSQIRFFQAQAKVEALLPFCPKVFENVLNKPEAEKAKK